MKVVILKENLLLFVLTLANYRNMSSKIHAKQHKGIEIPLTPFASLLTHIVDGQHDQKGLEQMERLRIIQNNLVFASSMPIDLNDAKLLKGNSYFGRYGNVVKVVVNSSAGVRKNATLQTYVTFQTELEASLAIVALDGFNLEERPLKVSYGTTKYCSHFLRGYQCSNPDCFYLHKIDKSRQVSSAQARNNFQLQNDTAFDVVSQHLEEVVEKAVQEKDPHPEEGFPSLTEMIEFLVQSNFLSKADVGHLIDKYKSRKQSAITCCSQNPPQGIDSPQQPKLTKCKSISTMSSPTKSLIEQKQSQKIQKGKKMSNIQKQTVQENEDRSTQKKEEVEQKIEKMIIKKMFVSPKQSQLGFANSTPQRQEQEFSKLKGIVEKYLINSN